MQADDKVNCFLIEHDARGSEALWAQITSLGPYRCQQLPALERPRMSASGKTLLALRPWSAFGWTADILPSADRRRALPADHRASCVGGELIQAVAQAIAAKPEFDDVETLHVDHVRRDKQGAGAQTVHAIDFRKDPQGQVQVPCELTRPAHRHWRAA